MDSLVHEFGLKFSYLRGHPDKVIIDDLTETCKRDIKAAYAITMTVVNRLQDPTTDPSFKLPTLYLIDNIMKRVGGTYPEYFSKHLAPLVHRAISEIAPQDRKKLGVLIKTWEERRLLPADVLSQLTSSVSQRLALDAANQTPYAPLPAHSVLPGQYPQPLAPSYAPPSHYQQPPHIPVPPHSAYFYPAPAGVGPHSMPLPLHAQPQMSKKRTSRFDAPSSASASNASSSAFQEAVRVEMATLLSQLLSDLGGAQLSLNELKQSNPDLYLQVQMQAEAAVHERMDSLSSSRGHAAHKGTANGGGSGYNQPLRATMDMHPVLLDPAKVEAVIAGLSQLAASDDKARSAAARVHESLQQLLADTHKTPPLPPILFGLLPLEPTAAFAASRAALYMQQQQQQNQHNTAGTRGHAATKRVKMVVRLGTAELTRNPTEALRGLYAERPFRWPEDGVRFKSQLQLNAYIDVYAEKRRASLRVEQSGVIARREWYCSLRAWISSTKSGASNTPDADGGTGGGAVAGGIGVNGKASAHDAGKEFIVPADEHFTRCPVSKETFETLWNDEEGEFMYKHAARVLVTPAADAAVFKMGQPTNQAGVRYIIAHKRLVVDEWLDVGKAATLGDAIKRYEAMASGSAKASVQALKLAAGEGEDEEGVFVMLELST